jgi:hypothetical protein
VDVRRAAGADARVAAALLATLFASVSLRDTQEGPLSSGGALDDDPSVEAATACQGDRAPLPVALEYELQAGAFPGSGHPDVAVHVPPGFDATQRPGVVLYFHGWNGCVATALGSGDAPCSEGGDPRAASDLAAQIDAAQVNALLVAVELRVDAPTGEPGQLAMPGDLRALLEELFVEHLAEPLGCALHVDELDRVVVVAHSGGYQAAASAIRFGDVAPIVEVDLLDAYYGADEVFREWIDDAVGAGRRPIEAPRPTLRFVDLYTDAAGTAARSRDLAAHARAAAGSYRDLVYDDDGSTELATSALARPVVFKRVPRVHAELPRAYLRPLVEAAGFSRPRRVRAWQEN